MLRGQQALFFSEEGKAISTHHITLGTAPIGGHGATVQASRLPAETLSVEEGLPGRSAPTGSGLATGSPLTITASPRPCPPHAQFLILLYSCDHLL